MKMTDQYEEQAQRFLADTGSSIEFKFLKHGKHFDDDKDSRDIYEVTLKRGDRQYVLKFGQSVAYSGRWIFWGPNGKELLNEPKRMPGYELERNKNFKEPTRPRSTNSRSARSGSFATCS